jgi:hypothetical protein
MPTNLRRRLMRLFGKSMHKLDPIVRKKLRDEHRQKVWLADQYYHPHETQHTVDEVLAWFEASGVEFISAIPPVAFGVPINAPLFRPQPKGGRLGHWLKQLRWVLSLGHEGGLFVMIGRRKVV